MSNEITPDVQLCCWCNEPIVDHTRREALQCLRRLALPMAMEATLAATLDTAVKRVPGERSWIMLSRDGWQIEYSRGEEELAAGDINTFARGETIPELLGWLMALPEKADLGYCPECDGKGGPDDEPEITCTACHGHGVRIVDADGALLTITEWAALGSVREGADVMHLVLAELLRSVERKTPGLIQITEAMGEYGVLDRQPYFGAIPSAWGLEELARYEVATGRTCTECGYQQELWRAKGDYRYWPGEGDICNRCVEKAENEPAKPGASPAKGPERRVTWGLARREGQIMIADLYTRTPLFVTRLYELLGEQPLASCIAEHGRPQILVVYDVMLLSSAVVAEAAELGIEEIVCVDPNLGRDDCPNRMSVLEAAMTALARRIPITDQTPWATFRWEPLWEDYDRPRVEGGGAL